MHGRRTLSLTFAHTARSRPAELMASPRMEEAFDDIAL
jgi:hypothetical protein